MDTEFKSRPLRREIDGWLLIFFGSRVLGVLGVLVNILNIFNYALYEYLPGYAVALALRIVLLVQLSRHSASFRWIYGGCVAVDFFIYIQFCLSPGVDLSLTLAQMSITMIIHSAWLVYLARARRVKDYLFEDASPMQQSWTDSVLFLCDRVHADHLASSFAQLSPRHTQAVALFPAYVFACDSAHSPDLFEAYEAVLWKTPVFRETAHGTYARAVQQYEVYCAAARQAANAPAGSLPATPLGRVAQETARALELDTAATAAEIYGLLRTAAAEYNAAFAAPAPGTAAPMPGTAAPAPGTAAPMPGTAAPMPGTAAPAPGTAAPMPGTAAPMPGTAAPMSGTAAPAPGTAAPAPGTAAPAPGTTAPARRYCPFCGTLCTEADASFCTACGARLPCG